MSIKSTEKRGKIKEKKRKQVKIIDLAEILSREEYKNLIISDDDLYKQQQKFNCVYDDDKFYEKEEISKSYHKEITKDKKPIQNIIKEKIMSEEKEENSYVEKMAKLFTNGFSNVSNIFDTISENIRNITPFTWSGFQSTYLVNDKPIYMYTFDKREYILYPNEEIEKRAYEPGIYVEQSVPKRDPKQRKVDIHDNTFKTSTTKYLLPSKTRPVLIHGLGAIAFYDREDLIYYKNKSGINSTIFEKYLYESLGKYLDNGFCGTSMLNISNNDYYTVINGKVVQIPKGDPALFTNIIEKEIVKNKIDIALYDVILFIHGFLEKTEDENGITSYKSSASLFSLSERTTKDDNSLSVSILFYPKAFRESKPLHPLRVKDSHYILFATAEGADKFLNHPEYKGSVDKLIIKTAADIFLNHEEEMKEKFGDPKKRNKRIAKLVINFFLSGMAIPVLIYGIVKIISNRTNIIGFIVGLFKSKKVVDTAKAFMMFA